MCVCVCVCVFCLCVCVCVCFFTVCVCLCMHAWLLNNTEVLCLCTLCQYATRCVISISASPSFLKWSNTEYLYLVCKVLNWPSQQKWPFWTLPKHELLCIRFRPLVSKPVPEIDPDRPLGLLLTIHSINSLLSRSLHRPSPQSVRQLLVSANLIARCSLAFPGSPLRAQETKIK